MIAYFERQLAAVSVCFTALAPEDFNVLVDTCTGTLKKGNTIIASGLGKNVPVCEKFVGTMNSLGLNARFLHTNSAIHGDLGMVSDGDLVLLLSKSGSTEESVVLAGYLLKRGVEVRLLSFHGESRLASMLEHKLIMRLENEGDPWDIVPNNSTVVYLMLLQGLAMGIAENMKVQLRDFKQNHPGGSIGEKLKGYHDG
jgi:arabinose-5-phosphate isomerase